MTTTVSREHAAADTGFEPSRTLRALGAFAAAYRHVFADSRAAPLLSTPNPVRRTGFELELVVREMTTEADGVLALRLAAPDGAELPRWVPGAHLDVFLPSGRQRQYSLCGDPAERCTYRIAVRRLADGFGGSTEIHDELEAGSRVTVRGPRNAFRLIEAESYLFVAGGIGITPILPMVRRCAERGLQWRLVYLGRSRASMPFLDELALLRGGTVDLRPDDEYGPPDMTGILPLAAQGAAVYLCGPDPLMSTARPIMNKINPSGSLHTERFSARPVVDGQPFEVRLRRSGTTVAVDAEETALAAIRREVPGVAYSCRQGFCGTCKTRVLAGEVEHRDRLLTDEERQEAMLICVSRAAGGTVELDL